MSVCVVVILEICRSHTVHMTKICQSSDLQQVNNVLFYRQFFQYVDISSSMLPSYSTNLY